MNHYIDTRGIDADKSWSMVKECMADFQEGRLTTVTDSLETARYIHKMADQSGLDSQLEEMGGEYYVHFINQTGLREHEKNKPPAKNMVLVITGNTMGRGEEALGKVLLKGYFHNLKLVKPFPRTIIFLNKGVFLTMEGSEMMADLKALWENGVEIISSSACLDFYNCKQRLAVGGVAGMREIVERMAKGENTVVL